MRHHVIHLLLSIWVFIGLPNVLVAQTVATVNGKAIPKIKLDQTIAELKQRGQQDSPQLQQVVKDDLIMRELILQEAEKKGVQNNEAIKQALDSLRSQLMVQTFIQDYVRNNPPTEDEYKEEYFRIKKVMGGTEYKVRHVLVEKQEIAKGIIEQFKKGTKFDELAKQSKDTATAQKGGDLGWIFPSNVTKPFGDAVLRLGRNQFTPEPVATQLGWHVIWLEDMRPARIPTLDELKPQLAQSLSQKKLQQFQDDLRSKAKIQ